MKRIEEDGKVYFCWEEHEKAEQKAFEEADICDEEEMLFTFWKSLQRLKAERKRRWLKIHQMTEVSPNEFGFEYDHMENRFQVIPKDEADRHIG